MAQRALKQTKFIYAAPVVEGDKAKEDEDGGIEGGDEGVEEELDNKELMEEDLGGEADQPKEKGKTQDGEDE